jgi:hypothetical protein
MTMQEQSEQPIVLDEGMRRWYQSCRCCFGDAHPELRKQLDEEHKAARQQPSGPGICEQAETAH